MSEIRIAKRYARAALSTALKSDTLEILYKDFTFIKNTIKESRELELLFKNPIIHKEKKIEIIKILFEKRIDKISLDFINFLIHKGRDVIITDIIDSFIELYNDYHGLLIVKVIGFNPISDEQRSKIIERLEKLTSKKINLSFILDKSILGGIIIQIADTVLDSSIKRRLELLKAHLLKAS
jgi:F-type H+-transporting ATPase subunit delta